MNEYFFTLSFTLIPLCTALAFACITPPLGATLSLRNEILLGISLPPVGSAVIALTMFCGIPPDAYLLHYLITALTLFLVVIVLPLNVGKKQISIRRRELILGALFCIGNMLTLLFMALSPRVESHFRNILQGELLAVTTMELTLTVVFSALFLVAGFKFRGVLYAYSLDEEGLKIKEKRYTVITLLYRAAATLVITGGIILIGPLLTTSLLIIPAFLSERHSRGLDRFMIITVVIGITGTISGFLISVARDLPPAPVIVCMLVLVGLLTRFLPGGKKS